MKNEIANKAFEYIDAIAAKMGVAAEHVYGILVRQQLAEGIAYSLLTTLAVIVFAVAYTKLFKAYRKCDGYGDEAFIYALIFGGILGLVIVITWFFVFPNGIMKIVNPEYYAIKEILNALGGK